MLTENPSQVLDTAKGIFGNASFKAHEQVVFCQDEETGLKAIIGIHSTTLGPALGGTRMWNYTSEFEAIKDVLRLSRGMSFKASISGLDLGGGKAVIIGDARKDKNEAMMRKFGQFVDSLSGRYITAEDVGISTKDMEYVKMETDHVTGIPVSMGGSGDPSPYTAYGVFMGMKACANYKWGSDSLEGRTVVVQGVGHVGETVVKHATEAGANVIVNDIYDDTLEHVASKYNAEIFKGDIYDLDMDIYAPCALGATINDNTVDRIKCEIVAGAANNQLALEDKHGTLLKERGIIYAPDFLINAGGLINVNSEIAKYSRDEVMTRTEDIYNTTMRIINESDALDMTTHQAALKLAQERIDAAKK